MILKIRNVFNFSPLKYLTLIFLVCNYHIYLLLSVSIIYVLGLAGLWYYMGLDKSLNEIFLIGAKPFLLIEMYKILILTVLSKQLFKFRKFI